MGIHDRSQERDIGVALRHPLRRRLLTLVLDGEQASTRQLSGAVKRPLSNVRYHLRVLAQCGAVSSVGAEPGGGSPPDIYRCALDPARVRRALDLAAPEQPDRPAGEIPGERAL